MTIDKTIAMDREPRYVPDRVVIFDGMIVHAKVTGSTFYPPGQHPAGCPLVPHIGALEVKTQSNKSRWYGCEWAYINSELRMVAVGFPAADEEMAKWEKVPKDKQV